MTMPIEGTSYRLPEHAALIPEHLRNRPLMVEPSSTPLIKRRHGRPGKEVAASTSG